MSHMSDRGPRAHHCTFSRACTEGREGRRGRGGPGTLKGDAILANLHALGPVTKRYSEKNQPLAALVYFQIKLKPF